MLRIRTKLPQEYRQKQFMPYPRVEPTDRIGLRDARSRDSSYSGHGFIWRADAAHGKAGEGHHGRCQHGEEQDKESRGQTVQNDAGKMTQIRHQALRIGSISARRLIGKVGS